MRTWEETLRRSDVAWSDFKAWIGEVETQETSALMTAENIERQRGKVEGVRTVFLRATANEREEIARAGRDQKRG